MIRLATPCRLKETTVYLSPLLPKQGKASSAQTTERVPAKGGQAGSLPEARDRPSPTVGFRCTHVDSQGQRMGPELAQNPLAFSGQGDGSHQPLEGVLQFPSTDAVSGVPAQCRAVCICQGECEGPNM